MKSIMIDKDNFAIILTQNDITEYNDKDGEGFENILGDVMADASEECGFDITYGNFSVGVFLSGSGDCEMFVTRKNSGNALPCGNYSISKEDTDFMRYIYEKDEKSTDTALKSTDIRKKMTFAYRFCDFELFLSACRMISDADSGAKSCAYYDSLNDNFYIMSTAASPIAIEMGAEALEISEIKYIYEYCTEICSGDIKKLGFFAV